MKRAIITLSGLLLVACGQRDPLRPAAGMQAPPKPALATHAPTVAELLTPSPEARPEREDEPLTRSAPREEDRFDLPPPG